MRPIGKKMIMMLVAFVIAMSSMLCLQFIETHHGANVSSTGFGRVSIFAFLDESTAHMWQKAMMGVFVVSAGYLWIAGVILIFQEWKQP